MKKKWMASTALACSCMLLISGCSGNKADDFDAVAYTTAYLDGMIRGNVETLSSLSGVSSDDLTATFNSMIDDLVSSSIGGDGSSPGSTQISPQLRQDYTDFWKQAFSNTKYDVKKADKKENTYQITVDTQQMQLYTAMEPIYDEKLADYLKDNSVDSDQYIEDVYSLMLEAYQTALDKAEYNDPESVTVTLQKDDSEQWSISSDDMTTLKNALIDLASLNPSADGTTGTPAQVTAEDIANSQSEGAPNMEYPKDLESTPAYKVGDAITIQSDGKDVATFTIDKVEVTDDRSEYDTSNPDKVIVITYTYKNLAFDDPLLYDQMSFRVLDGDTVCLPYYLADLTSPDLATTGGDAETATAAYGISASCNEVTIYVDGAQIAFASSRFPHLFHNVIFFKKLSVFVFRLKDRRSFSYLIAESSCFIHTGTFHSRFLHRYRPGFHRCAHDPPGIPPVCYRYNHGLHIRPE